MTSVYCGTKLFVQRTRLNEKLIEKFQVNFSSVVEFFALVLFSVLNGLKITIAFITEINFK